jgi:hypothetical protein
MMIELDLRDMYEKKLKCNLIGEPGSGGTGRRGETLGICCGESENRITGWKKRFPFAKET